MFPKIATHIGTNSYYIFFNPLFQILERCFEIAGIHALLCIYSTQIFNCCSIPLFGSSFQVGLGLFMVIKRFI